MPLYGPPTQHDGLLGSAGKPPAPLPPLGDESPPTLPSRDGLPSPRDGHPPLLGDGHPPLS
jgi:hypothetical protein